VPSLGLLILSVGLVLVTAHMVVTWLVAQAAGQRCSSLVRWRCCEQILFIRRLLLRRRVVRLRAQLFSLPTSSRWTFSAQSNSSCVRAVFALHNRKISEGQGGGGLRRYSWLALPNHCQFCVIYTLNKLHISQL
jgi:hypothetical protein